MVDIASAFSSKEDLVSTTIKSRFYIQLREVNPFSLCSKRSDGRLTEISLHGSAPESIYSPANLPLNLYTMSKQETIITGK